VSVRPVAVIHLSARSSAWKALIVGQMRESAGKGGEICAFAPFIEHIHAVF
jgi:hypothetical protein